MKELVSKIQASSTDSGSQLSDGIDASVLLISACQDKQTALDITTNGLFTQQFVTQFEEWKTNGFCGNYNQFYEVVKGRVEDKAAEFSRIQNPNYYWSGRPNSAFEQQFPLSIYTASNDKFAFIGCAYDPLRVILSSVPPLTLSVTMIAPRPAQPSVQKLRRMLLSRPRTPLRMWSPRSPLLAAMSRVCPHSPLLSPSINCVTLGSFA